MQGDSRDFGRVWWLWLACTLVVLHILSLCLTAYTLDGQAVRGWQVWLTSLICWFPGWVANPCFWIGAVLLARGQTRKSARWGLVGLAFAIISFALFFEIPGERTVGTGLLLWMLSLFGLVVPRMLGYDDEQE